MRAITITRKNHLKYLRQASKLMDIDPAPETKEGKRLLFLADAIATYENKKFQLPAIAF